MTQVSQAEPQRATRAAGPAVAPRPIIRGARAGLPEPTQRQIEADAFLADVFSAYSGTGSSLWQYAARHPRLVLRTLAAVRRLPELAVELPEGPETGAVAQALLEHPHSRRAMLGVASVLRTPDAPGAFTEGSLKGTLRRKMRSASKLGVTIRPVHPSDRPALLELARLHERENEREEYRNVSPDIDDLLDYDLWLAAFDGDAAPIALTVIPTAGDWAVLRYFRTLVAGQDSSDARYLMTDALAEELARRGVHYLVDSARPHWLPNGLRHFQRMVGFRLVRLRSIRVARD